MGWYVCRVVAALSYPKYWANWGVRTSWKEDHQLGPLLPRAASSSSPTTVSSVKP